MVASRLSSHQLYKITFIDGSFLRPVNSIISMTTERQALLTTEENNSKQRLYYQLVSCHHLLQLGLHHHINCLRRTFIPVNEFLHFGHCSQMVLGTSMGVGLGGHFYPQTEWFAHKLTRIMTAYLRWCKKNTSTTKHTIYR